MAVEVHVIRSRGSSTSFKLKKGNDVIVTVQQSQLSMITVDMSMKRLMLRTEVDEPAKTISFATEKDLRSFGANFPEI